MRTVLDLESVAPDGIVGETVENQCLENAASRRTSAYHCTADLLVTQLEDLLLCIWKCAIMNPAGDVSNDAGDGMANCAHFGLAPLDVHPRIFWRTTSNPLQYQVYYSLPWVKQSAEMRSALEFFATAQSRTGAVCCSEKLEGNRDLQDRCPLVAERAR